MPEDTELSRPLLTAMDPKDQFTSHYGAVAPDHNVESGIISSSGGHDHDGDLVTAEENQNLKRGLQQRHLSMLGIAGAIGTGLFLGLGGAVQTAGPLGALLGYAVIGLVVCAVQFALGEVAALLPVTGAFVRHAEFLVDPALGFAIGWNLVYGNILSIPTETTAIVVLFQFWWEEVNPAVWIIIFIVLTAAVGFSFIRVFGEIEFVFAMIKILLVIFLIILGLVINLGGIPGTERIGFRYWQDPGPFVELLPIASGNWGKFLGFWSVMTGAVFSFAGVESLAMAAAEARNPKRAIPRACKRVFARIVIFYILAVLIVGMLVASDDERLDDESGTAAQSPFVIAASAAGISAIPSVVNAIVITSAWSASNQALLTGTRVLYGLALKGQAPKVFLRTTSWGVPYVCVSLYVVFMFLSFMSLSNGAYTVFWWLVDLTAAGVLISWSTILLNHLRLKMALQKQGIDANRLPWNNSWTFYSSAVGLFMCLLILFTGGFVVFCDGQWDTATFISSYLDIPLVLCAYLIWKFIKKTKIVPLESIPLVEALAQADQYPEDPEEKSKGALRLSPQILSLATASAKFQTAVTGPQATSPILSPSRFFATSISFRPATDTNRPSPQQETRVKIFIDIAIYADRLTQPQSIQSSSWEAGAWADIVFFFFLYRVNLRTQKRLAASVIGCGKNKIWLDPNEVSEISNANSRQTIRKLVKDGLIIQKPVTMHSRSRARELNLARRDGRHRGFGKRKGTADARMPSQVLWMRRLRVLRRLLVKYRASGKIDKHLYHELYHSSKGNTFKHKRALVEHIHRAKAEKARERALKEEMDAKRAKTKAARERKQERVAAKREALVGGEEEEK
ncbi:Dicarboxylic amino acid permease 3 [Seiridium cupressi]